MFLYFLFCDHFGFFFSSRRRHTRCALVTGVQTCALPISLISETNAVAFASKLQVNGAIRIEDHRGIDRVTTPKLGLIYGPIHGLELKASWGKSFKEIGRASCRERVCQYV